MAKTIIRWKPGKSGLYDSYTIRKEDWERMGFEGAAAETVVFSRAKNFALIVDDADVPFEVMEYYKGEKEFEIKSESDPVTQSKEAVVTEQVTTGVAANNPKARKLSADETGELAADNPQDKEKRGQ